MNPYQIAKDKGYTDEQILSYHSKKDPDFQNKYRLAKDKGYTDEQIYSFLSQKKQSTQTNQEKPYDPFSEDNDLEREIERNIAQQTSRQLETVLGLPGDIESLGRHLVGSESESILPTSQKLREFSEKVSLGYTKPHSETEEKFGEISSDIASMMIPGGGHYSMARNIGIPIVGNLAKEGIKYLGGEEKAQAYGKVGTMVVLDLLSRRSGGAKKYVSSLFQEAEQSIPEGVKTTAINLEKSLDKLEKSFSAGGTRPTTKKALEKVAEIRKEINNGEIDVKRLAAYRPSINEAIEELGGFQLEIPKKLKPQAIRNLNEVKNEVIKTLYDYGENFNPEYLNLSKSANEAYAALQKSNLIANFIQDKVNYSPKSKTVQTLFSYAPTAGIAALAKLSPAAAAGVTTGIAGYQGIKILHRILNSPTLRKYYGNVLKEAAARNVSSTTKNLKALDINAKHLDDHLESEIESFE